MVQDAGIWRVQFVGVQAHLEDEVVERVADLGLCVARGDSVSICTQQWGSWVVGFKRHSYILARIRVGEVVCAQQRWAVVSPRPSTLTLAVWGLGAGGRTGHSMVLAVVLELLGRHGGAKEVLEVLEDVLLRRRKGARLRGLLEACHAYVVAVYECYLVLVQWALGCFFSGTRPLLTESAHFF
jgi:hypothetical protein